MGILSSGGPAPSNGLGNLADELADAWDDDEGDGDAEDYDVEKPEMSFHVEGSSCQPDGNHDSGVDVMDKPVLGPVNLTPPFENGRAHRRKASEYDGSDYGGDSDLESPGIAPGLQQKMDMVESLARRGTENNGSDHDLVVKRLVDGLKDLGGQSSVESNATRLITAHTALSTHLVNQTRLLQSLAYPIFSPLTTPPSHEEIDALLPLIIALPTTLPRPTTAAHASLTQLHTLTSDLVHTLNYLSDTLHMSRQTTVQANRRLKSAKELVAEMRRDEEKREEGERWLRKGDWGARLERRECAGVCGDVVSGFEEVCNGWRERLVKSGEAIGA